jgi:Kef-type K+ transport system membrane component KefB
MLAPLANLGLALFMFLVGLELDRALLAGRARVMIGVSLGSVVVPFATGTALGWYLFSRYPSAHRLGFVLFVGVAMAATAFPVLARIVTDRGISATPVGGLALASAAIGDVLVWLMLAAVVTMVGGDGAQAWRLTLVVPYTGAMFLIVRPLLRRWAVGRAEFTAGDLALIVVGVLLSGGFTQWIGLHFVFGAFLLGFVVPKDGEAILRHAIHRHIADLGGLLLPIYFFTAGLQVNLSGIGLSGLADLGLIILVAVGGKVVGVYGAARAGRLPTREAAELAILMNTRGLTELVILTVGFQLGLLRETLYSLAVAMAVLTTVMTGPLLTLLDQRGRVGSALAPAAGTSS